MRDTGDRRLSRRYEVGPVPIRVRVLPVSTASEWHVAALLDLSGNGVSFLCGQPLPVNTRIEMVIDWPAQQSLPPIRLRALGNVVRCHDGKIAARMTFYRMGIEQATSAAVNTASDNSS